MTRLTRGVALIVVLTVTGCAWLGPTPNVPPTATVPPAATAAAPAAPAAVAPTAPAASESLAYAVRRVADLRKPGVVLIASLGASSASPTADTAEPQGIGSGAIIDNAGHIVTNNHVVEGAQGYRVVLPDGRTFDGQLQGRDPRTDLAVVTIKGDNLPTVPLATSLNVQVGDWVVAIGNALGLPGGPTVTAGVVGALGRTITEPNGVGLEDLIQTDAAINPGNSGGPLLNLKGEIVGINTAGAEGAQGLGFAVSIDTVRDIVPQLIANGRVVRPFIGINTMEITPGIAARSNLSRQDGLGIVLVVPGSPAEHAGLRSGDIIITADGHKIANQRDLSAVLATLQPGNQLPLTVQRGNQETSITVTLGESPRPS
ncbi:MAG: trypsin-like peptidase domain-containing protein [Chloroflexi bacterium]|nr:trypsin-like peptidase domain-containing protein [Chloroflexota bacterium]